MPFVKGQSGNPTGKKQLPDEPLPEADAGFEGAGDLLRAVRWAFRNHGRRCRGTGAEEEMRALFKANPEKFIDLKVKLEAAWKAERPAVVEPVVAEVKDHRPPPDEGTARCLELAEQVIRDILAKRGKK